MKQIIYSNQEEKISKQVEGLIEEQERILAQAQKAAQNCPEGSLKVQKKEVFCKDTSYAGKECANSEKNATDISI